MALRALSMCLLAVLALLSAPAGASAEKRVALVIGNSAYQKVPPLPNPANDAGAVAAMFKNIGFDAVTSKRDLTNAALHRAVREFALTARDADIAVVYYAGHGIEASGINHLIPIDAALKYDIDVEDETISLNRIMRVLEPVKRLRLVILDACRDNPFVGGMQRTIASRSIGRGLAKIEVTTTDTLVAYAAKAGMTAADGDGRHSPFTAALLANLPTPGLDLRIAFGRVRDDVLRKTGNKQEPFVYGSLGGATVALVTKPAAPVATAKPAQATGPSADAEARDYAFAERIGTQRAWDSYIAAHPTGFYANLARAARDKLRAAQARTEIAATAKPEQPAPKRQDPDIPLESLARNFLADYMRHSEGALPDVVAYVRKTFAPEVDHFGERKSNKQVVEDQRRYIKRWPQRRYRVRPGTTRIDCDKARSSCLVAGELDYEVSNPGAGKRSTGVTTFEFRVRFTAGGPKIIFENGQVVSR